jgi:chromosome segregation ATPase
MSSSLENIAAKAEIVKRPDNDSIDNASTAHSFTAAAAANVQEFVPRIPPGKVMALPADKTRSNSQSTEGGDAKEQPPSPARSPSGKRLLEKRASTMVSTKDSSQTLGRSNSNDSASSGAHAQEALKRNQLKNAHLQQQRQAHAGHSVSNEELMKRLARAEAQISKFHRQIVATNQQVEFFKRACVEKDRGLGEREQHIAHLTHQMGGLVRENQQFRSAAGPAKAAQAAQMEQTRQRLFNEMENVRREKAEMTKGFQVQNEALNKKLASGQEQAQRAMAMQSTMKTQMAEQNQVMEAMEKELAQCKQVISNQEQDKNELKSVLEALEKEQAKFSFAKVASQAAASEETPSAKSVDKAAQKAAESKEMKKLKKELQAEKDFIVDLKQRYTKKKEECVEMRKQCIAAGKGAGKGGKAGDKHLVAENADLNTMVKELTAQLQATTADANKKLEMQRQHILMLERTDKENATKMQQVFEDHDEQIFKYKRAIEQVQDAKVDAISQMRKKIDHARQIKEETESKGFAGLSGRLARALGDSRMGNQASFLVHFIMVALVVMFAYDALF